jgi:hypothetical protein
MWLSLADPCIHAPLSKYLLAVFSSTLALSPLLRCYSVLESIPLVSYLLVFFTRTQRTDGGPSFNCCRYTSLYCTTHHTAREVKVLDVHSSQTIPLHSSREGFGVRIPFALPRLRVCGDEHGSHEHPLDFFPYDKPTVSLSEVLPPFKPRLPASKWQHERPNHRYPATDCRQSHAVALLSHRIE